MRLTHVPRDQPQHPALLAHQGVLQQAYAKRHDLYANARSIKTFEGAPAPLGDVDFVAGREATEGMYFGKEIEMRDDTFLAIGRITKRLREYLKICF